MNTSQLECFVRVAETRNFQQTAEALHISQPAVSKQIAALENELGARLFLRTTRTVSLTPAGETFLPDARNILRLTYHARQMIVENKQRAGHMLRIGYSDPNELIHMGEVLSRLRERYADFTPLLVYNKWDANVAQLESGQVDVCFALADGKRHGKLQFQSLGNGPLVCVLPKGHPLAHLPSIRYEQVRDENQIRIVPLILRNQFYNAEKDILLPMDTKEEKATLCDNSAEAFGLVTARFGYCLVPWYFVPQHEELVGVPCDLYMNLTHGVYYTESGMTPLLREFLQLVQDVCTQGGN